MHDSCYLTRLDLHEPKILLPFTAKKGDTGRKLLFTLTDKGKPYIISSDCNAVFTAKKPDGSIIYNNCEIVNNTISYTFTPQTCSARGAMPCEIRLYGADDKLITSPRFTLLVEDTVYTDGDMIESDSEVSALTSLISDATTLIRDVENKMAANAYANAHSAVCYTSQSLLDNQKAQARANIGAAPEGFGLGTPAKIVSDPDSISATGFYAVGNSSVMPNNHWWMGYHIHFRDVGYDFQWFYDLQTGCSIQRYNYVSIWQEWEWNNPRMVTGVEYRTTERWNGNVVYAKLLEIGTLPNCSFKDVSIGTKISNLVDLKVTAVTPSLTYKLLTSNTSSEIYASILWGASIRIYSLSLDSSEYIGLALIKYTK